MVTVKKKGGNERAKREKEGVSSRYDAGSGVSV
jgi:hypothetical protein